jgi:tryptophan synthase alpha chain
MTSQAVPRRTIAEAFAAARSRGKIALMPFISAGYPDFATTAATLRALDQAGADLVEIGFPFSDPIADGPVIQESYTVALGKHVKVDEVFETIAQTRASIGLPLVAMVSYSVVYRYELARFIARAKSAGLDALLLPDLPPPEAKPVCDQVRAGGLDTVLLVAPTTSPQRRKEVAALCSGFVYYLSITGITGERDRLPADLEANVRAIKQATDRPVCVGFGISKPQHIHQLSDVADGAIVGSAVVKRMTQHATEGPESIAKAVATYCRELRP